MLCQGTFLQLFEPAFNIKTEGFVKLFQ